MRNRLSILTALFFFQFAAAQNLVNNPSFEEGLPEKTITSRNPEGDAGRPFIPGWWVPTMGSPDIFNSERSKANSVPVPRAHSGKAQAGLVLAESKNLSTYYGGSYKEYIQGELKEELIAGQKYHVEFYLAADRSDAFYAKNIGAHLSKKSITQKNRTGLDLVPHIKMEIDTITTVLDGWVKICGVYTAEGGEKYITIGSFGQEFMQSYRMANIEPNDKTGKVFRNAYYFIDDVLVEAIPENKTDCCNRSNEKKVNILFAIEDFDAYFVGENRTSLLDALNSIIADLPSNYFIKLIVKGASDDSLIFEPVSDYKNNSEKLFKNLSIVDYKYDLPQTLSKYYTLIERNNIAGVHVLTICAGKMKINKNNKDQLIAGYAKNGTTFSVLQVNGKYSNAMRNFTSQTKGAYVWSDMKSLKSESNQVGKYIKNIDHRISYAKRANLKTFFILGAVAIVAMVTATVL